MNFQITKNPSRSERVLEVPIKPWTHETAKKGREIVIIVIVLVPVPGKTDDGTGVLEVWGFDRRCSLGQSCHLGLQDPSFVAFLLFICFLLPVALGAIGVPPRNIGVTGRGRIAEQDILIHPKSERCLHCVRAPAYFWVGYRFLPKQT